MASQGQNIQQTGSGQTNQLLVSKFKDPHKRSQQVAKPAPGATATSVHHTAASNSLKRKRTSIQGGAGANSVGKTATKLATKLKP